MKVQMDRPHAKYVNDKPIVEMDCVPRKGDTVILTDESGEDEAWQVNSVTWLVGYIISGEDWLPHVRLHLLPEGWDLDEDAVDEQVGTIERLIRLWGERSR